jgi:hypothetical protein
MQLELPQHRPGVDAELLDQRPASALERMQRVGLPATAVQREHQLAAQALAKRVLRDERLELRDQLVMAAECQLSVDAILDRRETKLFEPGDLALRECVVSQLGEGLPAPERKRLAQAGHRSSGSSCSRAWETSDSNRATSTSPAETRRR